MVTVINFLEHQPEWKNTAVIVAYDDSDGWYDHQMGPIVNQSTSKADGLTGPGQCGDGATALPGPAVDHAQGRCGYGPRLPLLVISPFARRNFVDHSLTDQTSVLRFIEDNWLNGERVGGGSFDAIAGSINAMFDFAHPDARPYILDTSTGQSSQAVGGRFELHMSTIHFQLPSACFFHISSVFPWSVDGLAMGIGGGEFDRRPGYTQGRLIEPLRPSTVPS